jgi:protein TonB
MAGVSQILSRHGALIASVAFHGAAVALLLFELNPPPLTTPANAETPAVAVEVITMPTPEPDLVTTTAPPPPPPEPELPEVFEEPPPLIESMVAETVAPPPPPPEVKPEPEKPKPRPKPVRMPKHKPVEPAPTPPQEIAEFTAPPAPPTPAPRAPQTAMAAPAGRAGPPPSYLALLHLALERNKNYPAQARQRRQQGRAMLRFAIDRDGNVLNYKIEKSSGYELLDREVIEMIKRASPLPPMPPEMAGSRFEALVPVPFVLR